MASKAGKRNERIMCYKIIEIGMTKFRSIISRASD